MELTEVFLNFVMGNSQGTLKTLLTSAPTHQQQQQPSHSSVSPPKPIRTFAESPPTHAAPPHRHLSGRPQIWNIKKVAVAETTEDGDESKGHHRCDNVRKDVNKMKKTQYYLPLSNR